jgi:hypothetical protein
VRRATGGRILDAKEPSDQDRIKVLTSSGDVRIVYVDVATGAVRCAGTAGSRRSRELNDRPARLKLVLDQRVPFAHDWLKPAMSRVRSGTC